MSYNKKGRIVIIDDDLEMRSLLNDYFCSKNFFVQTYSSALDALESFQKNVPLSDGAPPSEADLIITDIKMPKMSGIEFTGKMKKLYPEIPIIVATAFGSIETAIEAMQSGAFHYIVKPFKLAEITATVDKALEHRSLKQENKALRQEVHKSWSFSNVIGKSRGMREIFDLVSRVSQATANILITGESGTGKEMIARAVHNSGPRASKPFVAINCTAIPESLLESELFGHAKGSFTGAIQRKRGLFEEAEGGTLFLDEIGDMNVQLQSKLLRVIQERKIRAVGDTLDRSVDVRIIAATHKDLKAAIREGCFREDLYYRLSVIPIVIPPLRNRRDDIPALAEFFLKKYSVLNNSKTRGFTKGAMNRLLSLKWEGNVRELENVIERAVVLCQNELIDESDLPQGDTNSPTQFFDVATQSFPTMEQLEAKYIQLVLQKTGGRKDKAAQILGMNRRTLYRKEREYGLVPVGSPEEEDLEASAELEHNNS